MQELVNPTIRRAVESYFTTVARRDEAAWLATFAEDAISHDPVGAPPVEGRDGLREVWKILTSPFRALGFTVTKVFYCGSGAAVYWAADGTGVNGRTVRFEGITVFEIGTDGKIQALMSYWDPAAMMLALAGEQADDQA